MIHSFLQDSKSFSHNKLRYCGLAKREVLLLPPKLMSRTSMFVPNADDISILETVFSPSKLEEDLEIFISLGRKESATLPITSASTCNSGNVHQGLSSFHRTIVFLLDPIAEQCG